MIPLVLGAAVLAFLVWIGRQPRRARLQVRFVWTVISILAAAGAVFVGLRGGWMVSLLLVGVSAYLGRLARAPGPRARVSDPRTPRGVTQSMSAREACSILGVPEDADRARIEAAYRRLMRAAHPDHGGSTGLAAQINAARDRLLG